MVADPIRYTPVVKSYSWAEGDPDDYYAVMRIDPSGAFVRFEVDPWLPIEECGELEEGELYLVGWRGHDPHEARVWTWTDGIWEDEEGYEQQPPDYVHRMGPIRGPGETT